MNIVLFEGEPFFPRNDDRCQHIRKILRKGVGDRFFAGIVDGPEGEATITALDDSGLSFSFAPTHAPRGLYPVHLVVGFPRPIQLKRLLRDVASLGVASVTLAGTDLGEKSYRDSTLVDRGAARSGLLEGCSQAGATGVPRLEMAASIDAALDSFRALGRARVILLDTERPDCPLYRSPELARASDETPLALFIGSERGWTARERALFREAGASVCSLGTRILRTETACAAAIAIALSGAGFMDGNE
ncbi:MAG TPA: RsmE family RNA methyltransferase [Treponemataceae bacterium]|nr:RsmE family RNA methyltransferase [Treponemataceae bacterium]